MLVDNNIFSMFPVAPTLIQDCSDVEAKGLVNSGMYTVQPVDSGEPIEVYCDMETDGGNWTVCITGSQCSLDITSWTMFNASPCIRAPRVACGCFFNRFLAWLVGEALYCVDKLEHLTQLKAKFSCPRKDGVTWQPAITTDLLYRSMAIYTYHFYYPLRE